MTRAAFRPRPSSLPRWEGRLSRRVLRLSILGVALAFAVWGATEGIGSLLMGATLRNAFLPELQRLALTDRYNPRLFATLGLRLAEAGRYQDAANAFGQSIAAGENRREIWQAWAASAAASGDRIRADNILRVAAQSAPADARTALAEGKTRADALGPDAAGEPLADALSPEGLASLRNLYDATRPGVAGFLDWAADAYIGKRESAPGWTRRRELYAARPNDPTTLRIYGDALRQNQRFAEAETVLRKALDLAPNDADVHLAYADLLWERKAVARAGQEYIAALKIRPDNLPGLLGLGRVALDKKLIPISMDVCTRATKAAPDSADAWIGMGRAYYLQSLNIAGAMNAYETASRLAPERTDFFADWYQALRVAFKSQEGETLLRRRVAAAPDDYQARFLLRVTCWRTTRPPSARRKPNANSKPS